MRILVVDDEPSLRALLEVLLTREGYAVETAATVEEAVPRVEHADVVISDMKLGQGTGMDVLRAARALPLPPEVILITAFGTPVAAVEAMRAGAYDYICKPFDNEELKLLVQKALEKRGLVRENEALRSSLKLGGRFWVGQTQAMQRVWHLVQKVAVARSVVLITGESGTGKELVARAIHWEGARAGESFLPVNCAAIAEGVLESELFGHVKGAFTGALSDRPGLLASAGKGTVFLDEIGEISPAMQVRLLRVLQERKVKPVGSTQELPFEARIIAATNKDLAAEVKAGRFREDLFYRLNVITIELPPLRERRGDIRVLAQVFLERTAAELGRPNLHFTDEALRVLEGYGFPGNIRQLQNIVERAATLADGEQLGMESLPPALSGRAEPSTGKHDVALSSGFSLERHMDELERTYLVEALQRAGGVKTRAAELLGLTFRSFRYRLAKHGLAADDAAGHG